MKRNQVKVYEEKSELNRTRSIHTRWLFECEFNDAIRGDCYLVTGQPAE